MKRTLMATIACSLVAVAGYAGGLRKTDVSAEAVWVLHADMQSLNVSQIGKALLDQADEGAHARELSEFAGMMGFHPLRDLTDLTLYGESYEQGRGVIVARGHFPSSQVQSALRAEPDYRESSYNGHLLYSWLDAGERQQRVASFYDGRTVVLASTSEEAMGALDVLDGVRAGINGSGRLNVPATAAGVFLVGVMDNPSRASGNVRNTEFMAHADSIEFKAAEEGGTLMLDLTLLTDSTQSAGLVHDALVGILALAQLSMADTPEVTELVRGLSVEMNDHAVQVMLSVPVSKAVELMKGQGDNGKSVVHHGSVRAVRAVDVNAQPVQH